MTTNTPMPKDSLLAGAEILDELLSPHGFAFQFRAEGESPGGHFAWGEYVSGDRSLELHYHTDLASVTYHANGSKASHESYMTELGVWGKHRYPGTSGAYLDAFRHLAHDLAHARDFIAGDALVMLAAAEKEAHRDALELRRIKALYMGDGVRLDEMAEHFGAGRYAEVLALFAEVKFKDLLTEAENRMVETARERTGS
jgi:hypothetical protein